jgi:hypothetical protein
MKKVCQKYLKLWIPSHRNSLLFLKEKTLPKVFSIRKDSTDMLSSMFSIVEDVMYIVQCTMVFKIEFVENNGPTVLLLD